VSAAPVAGADEATAVAVARSLARAWPAAMAPVVICEQRDLHIGAVLGALRTLAEHGLAAEVGLARWVAVPPGGDGVDELVLVAEGPATVTGADFDARMVELTAAIAEVAAKVERLFVGLGKLAAEPDEGRHNWQCAKWLRLRAEVRQSPPAVWMAGMAVVASYRALPPGEQRAAVARWGEILGPDGSYEFFISRWPKDRLLALDAATPDGLLLNPRRGRRGAAAGDPRTGGATLELA
jgi:hypothetical protein